MALIQITNKLINIWKYNLNHLKKISKSIEDLVLLNLIVEWFNDIILDWFVSRQNNYKSKWKSIK